MASRGRGRTHSFWRGRWWQSGAAGLLAGGAEALGVLFPAVSPVLAALGGALTGSNAASNALFMPLQVEAARGLGISEMLTAAVQNVAGSHASMLAPQRMVLAATAAGLLGRRRHPAGLGRPRSGLHRPAGDSRDAPSLGRWSVGSGFLADSATWRSATTDAQRVGLLQTAAGSGSARALHARRRSFGGRLRTFWPERRASILHFSRRAIAFS